MQRYQRFTHMAVPYVGEIRMFAGNFAPAGWSFCEGQLLAISENDTLFNLIGTTYGGDGQNTFALPDLRGRIPMHMNFASGNIGQTGGVEAVTLSPNQLPPHNHLLTASSAVGSISSPQNAVFASHRDHKVFANNAAPSGAMPVSAVSTSGGSQPHENMPPYLCVSFIISLFGIFPSQT